VIRPRDATLAHLMLDGRWFLVAFFEGDKDVSICFRPSQPLREVMTAGRSDGATLALSKDAF